MLRNVPAYLQYIHETRIESNPSKPVEGVWNGLRGRYVPGALRARSFVDVAFTTPPIFFSHSDHVSQRRSLKESLPRELPLTRSPPCR